MGESYKAGVDGALQTVPLMVHYYPDPGVHFPLCV